MTQHHIDDERLSAHLDGVEDPARRGAPGLEQHLGACGVCRDRLEALLSARRLVATPVAPASPDVRSRAVMAALGAWPDAHNGQEPSVIGPSAPGTSLGDPSAPGTSVSEPSEEDRSVPGAGRTAQHRHRRAQVLIGAATAVVALAVAVPLAISSQGTSPSAAALHAPARSRSTSRAGSSPGSPARAAAGGGFASPGAEGTGTGTSSPDLNAPLSQGPPAGSSVVPTAALPDLGQVSSAEQVVARLRDAEPPNASSEKFGSLSNGAQVTSAFSRCVDMTRSTVGGGDHGPGLAATVTYGGLSALVMEFWPTSSLPPSGRIVVAVSTTDGCKLLARATM
jgi:hypothetical protein